MELKDKRIGFAITGSFCTLTSTFKMLEILKTDGCIITPIISETVASFDTRFTKAKDFVKKIEETAENKAITSIIEAEPIGPKKLLDLLIIAPCTGNTLAKINYGITDTTVTMSAKAHLRNSRPLLIGISTNDGLSNNAKNIANLMNVKNVFFIPYRQDDPEKKPSSTVADFTMIKETAEAALDGKQLQPILLKY